MAEQTASTGPILSVRNLATHFVQDEGTVRAVDGADFDLWPGKTLGIVGESGCGKSVMTRSLLQILERPGASWPAKCGSIGRGGTDRYRKDSAQGAPRCGLSAARRSRSSSRSP